MKKTLKKSKKESLYLTTNSQADVMELMTAFKKLSLECSKAGISTQPLIKLLSTISANVAISKGFAAVLTEKLHQSPIVMNRANLIDLSQMILDEAWETELTLTKLSQCLDTGSAQL